MGGDEDSQRMRATRAFCPSQIVCVGKLVSAGDSPGCHAYEAEAAAFLDCHFGGRGVYR